MQGGWFGTVTRAALCVHSLLRRRDVKVLEQNCAQIIVVGHTDSTEVPPQHAKQSRTSRKICLTVGQCSL